MSYTHSWSRVETPDGTLPLEPPDAYGRLALDTLAILAAAADAGLAIGDGIGEPSSRPRVDEGGICLNGVRPDRADTLAWPAHPGEPWFDVPGYRWWGACSTNRRAYGAVVGAVLIRASAHYGPSLRVTSEGAWNGTTLAGQWWPEWLAARRLVVEVFGPEADRSPLDPP